MQTLTLGPAAVAFAAILSIVGSELNSPDLDLSLRALVISLTLGVAGYMLHSLEDDSEPGRLRTSLWWLAGLVANVGHIALVAGIYYLIKNKNTDVALMFLITGSVLYVIFTLTFVGIRVYHRSP